MKRNTLGSKASITRSLFIASGEEIEITFEADFTPYDPGVVCGPPESCYPPEGGEREGGTVTLHLPGADVSIPWDAFFPSLASEISESEIETALEESAEPIEDPRY